MQPIRSLFTSLVLVTWIPAQGDGVAQDPITQIRRTYADLLAQRKADDEAIGAVVAQAKEADGQARIDLMHKAERMRRDAKKGTEAFSAAFKRIDWRKLDPKEDAQLLREGLTEAISDYNDPERAVLACRTLLSIFPDDHAAIYLRSKFLPKALIVADQPDEAVKVLRESLPAMRESKEPVNANHITNTMLTLGDLLSVRGDVEGAKKIFEEMAKSDNRVAADLGGLRDEIVGRPAPEIVSEQWIGGDARTIESLKGKVVMLGFFASWSPACRQASLLWNDLREEFAVHGLELIAVTRPTGHGFLPKDAGDVVNTGSPRHGMKPDEFFEHVTKYHENVGMTYPLVVASEDDFKAYHVLPLPTVVLIGRDGKIAMVSTSHEGDKLVEYGLRHLLAKKAE